MKKKHKNRKIRKLNKQLAISKSNEYGLQEQIKRLNQRIAEIGANTVTKDESGNVVAIKIKPMAYGDYAVLAKENWYEPFTTEAKKSLVENLAEGLINNNIVQFIVHDAAVFDPLNAGFITLGAKLFVVPWEKMKEG